MGNYSYKPLSDMCFFFEDQKKYLTKDQKNTSFNSLFELLESKNILFQQGINENNAKKNNNENEYLNDELNFYSYFFESKENQLVPWKKSNGDVFKMYEILTFGQRFSFLCGQSTTKANINYLNYFVLGILIEVHLPTWNFLIVSSRLKLLLSCSNTAL